MSALNTSPYIIAHRGGVGHDLNVQNTYAAIGHAIAADCEYVEIDIQLTQDKYFVCYHDDFIIVDNKKTYIHDMTLDEFERLAGDQHRYSTMLSWCKGLIRLHLDIKLKATSGSLDTSPEIMCVKEAIDVLGAENVIVSAFEDELIRRVSSWTKVNYPSLLVGLTLGTGRTKDQSWVEYLPILLRDLFPQRRLIATGATMIVALGIYARLTLATKSRRRHIPLLVWTIDKKSDINYWLRQQNVLGIITNYPSSFKKAS